MDVSVFYDTLFNSTLGLDDLGLENRERELVKLVETRTLVSFSQCVPAVYKTYLDMNDPSHMVRKDHHTIGTEFYLDDPILDRFNLEILELGFIEPSNTSVVDPYDPDSSAYYSGVLASRNAVSLEQVLMGTEYTRATTLIDSAMPWKRYQELRGPRIIYFKNWPKTAVEISLMVRWPNIASIPTEYFEQFLNLARLDCEAKLWMSLRYMEDIVTPTGNLNLRIDWSNSARERDEYFRELRSRSVPDRVAASYFTIL